MKGMTRFSLAASLLLLFLLPLLFGQLMATSLVKLHLSPATAVLLTIAIIVGGLVNLPVKRIERDDVIPVHPLAIFGVYRGPPQFRRVRRETIVAVNLGGCIIPTALALYELVHLAAAGPGTLVATAIAVGINTAVCYFLARPVPGVGILIPGLVPPFVAAAAALVLAPATAAPVAFVAGVAGTLIGADLLHLGAIERSAVGIASIGGAGTFDGIVLSGIVAAYLA
ncbi:MAG TPA: DUF1614 domain-containing protein [Stellaceae bacterium]|nr:DUF1614 domain-containing protein [Stellaceae bacterium]